MGEVTGLTERLAAATGADPAIDAEIARAFAIADDAYTASVETCRILARERLPDWHLHVGYGASGMFPYAALSRGEERFASEAPTLPLAILRAAAAAFRLKSKD